MPIKINRGFSAVMKIKSIETSGQTAMEFLEDGGYFGGGEGREGEEVGDKMLLGHQCLMDSLKRGSTAEFPSTCKSNSSP